MTGAERLPRYHAHGGSQPNTCSPENVGFPPQPPPFLYMGYTMYIYIYIVYIVYMYVLRPSTVCLSHMSPLHRVSIAYVHRVSIAYVTYTPCFYRICTPCVYRICHLYTVFLSHMYTVCLSHMSYIIHDMYTDVFRASISVLLRTQVSFSQPHVPGLCDTGHRYTACLSHMSYVHQLISCVYVIGFLSLTSCPSRPSYEPAAPRHKF